MSDRIKHQITRVVDAVDERHPPITLAELGHLADKARPEVTPARRLKGPLVAVAALAVVLVVVGGVALIGSDFFGGTVDGEPISLMDMAVGTSEGAEAAPPGSSLATGGTPTADIDGAVLADDGREPLPLGEIVTLPDNVRLDFLFEFCFDGCFRDAHFMDPNSPDLGSGVWEAGRPFHVRHGFVNEGDQPLGPGYDVALYVTPLDVPGEAGGVPTGGTRRYTSDYVLRGEAQHCGPGYKSQTEPVTCEWFVHDFPEGLSEGRWAMWTVWEAPCSAWTEIGLTNACGDPDKVMSFFSSGFDAPFGPAGASGPSYTEANMVDMSAVEIAGFLWGTDEAIGPWSPKLEADASGVAPTGGTPLPDVESATAGDDGAPRMPLGAVAQPSHELRLDFLHGPCDEGATLDTCYRDAVFVYPGEAAFIAAEGQGDRPFIVRHGFINDGPDPLGPEFDVVVYITPLDMPGEFGGDPTGETVRYTSDYVLRGTTDRCGPTYTSLDEPVTCEWFVHEFDEGLPVGRHAMWAFWEAPCSAWVEYGFIESCDRPGEVMSLFSSGVDSPFVPLRDLDEAIGGYTPEMTWGITLDDPYWGPGIHTVFMIADFHPLTVDQVDDLSGTLIWDETVVDLCNIQFRHVGDGYLFVGDIFQTVEGCGSNPTAMQDAFDEFGIPNVACLTVTAGGVDHEYCAPLN
jgi:hypothetical protein